MESPQGTNDQPEVNQEQSSPPGPLIAKWFPQLHEELAHLFGAGIRDGSLHALGGAAKGFLLYFVPITLLRRKLTGNVRRSLAIGTFVGGVRLLSHVIQKQSAAFLSARADQNQRSDAVQTHPRVMTVVKLLRRYHRAVAAFLSALVASVVDGQLHNSTVLLFWVLIRAARCFLPTIPGGPTIAVCISACQILSTWVFSPIDLDRSYKAFLDAHGGKTKQQMIDFASLTTTPCIAMHGGQTCEEHVMTFFPQAAWRALKLYLPVHLLILLFSRSRSLKFFLENLTRSVLFLSLYTTLSWYSGCWLFGRIAPAIKEGGLVCSHSTTWLFVWMAGVPTLLERPGRQAELAAYCSTYAFESLYKRWIRLGYIRHNPVLAVALIALSAATMLHNHKQQPQMLMKWLFKIME